MIRVDHRLKKGLGPFAEIGTSQPAVLNNFSKPELAASDFSSFRENMKLLIDTG